MNTFVALLWVIGAYALGSLSFAVIISRFMRLSDPRTYGSKNPGATNVLRSGNKVAAILTLVLDALKGAVAIWLMPLAGLDPSSALAGWVGLAAFVGHLFPVFFHFKGGKGVATAAGVVLALNWPLGLATVVTFAVVLGIWRYVSLASIVAAALAPLWLMMGNGDMWRLPGEWALMLLIMAVLLIWRHAANVNRLLARTESKIGSSKK